MDEDDKKQMDNQISKEKAAGLYPDEDEFQDIEGIFFINNSEE